MIKQRLLIVLIALVSFSGTSIAETSAVLKSAQAEANAQRVITRNREAVFSSNLKEKKQSLKRLREALQYAENKSAEFEERFNTNETKLVEKQALYKERLGTFNELLGVVRQVSSDTHAQFENSLISSHLPQRMALLENIKKNKVLPETEDLSSLWQLMLVEMREQGRNLRYEADVIDDQGLVSRQTVTRIGPFVAFNEAGKFLNYNRATHGFNELSRQPRNDYRSAAKRYVEFDDEGEVLVPIDPSRGAILALLIQRPSILERIGQGGMIGYIILGIAAIASLLALVRLVTLALAESRLRKQLANLDKPSPDNALGKILEITQRYPTLDIEHLEIKFDNIILATASRLRRGLGTIKVLASMAPLLGLLGTVTGMIETFQVITLFGSGDARLMAGGISQALVTTALGLGTAIPILLLHSIANSRSRILVELLEEQAAGIVAQAAPSSAAARQSVAKAP
ncbi:MAG: MotA/TolQ/ExbB proton channel family protein [Gammaproteobacteria bacterium]|nr:MotA/TolQ/ExbB proton channel family protein [Gammaproteobacteria bacterium]